MLIQCVDGSYHRDPSYLTEKWVIQCNDDGVIVSFAGGATWRTVRKHLKREGVKCRFEAELGAGQIILGTRLVMVSKFKIRLTGPLLNPSASKGSVIDRPEDSSLDGEKLLHWN